jgi:hypothetical protein
MAASDLEREIQGSIYGQRSRARLLFGVVEFLYWAAVLSSSLAALTAATGLRKEIVAVLAAIPAFVLLVEKQFRYRERADWRFQYKRRLVGLLRELRDQGATPADVSKRVTLLEEEMDRTYPGASGLVVHAREADR